MKKKINNKTYYFTKFTLINGYGKKYYYGNLELQYANCRDGFHKTGIFGLAKLLTKDRIFKPRVAHWIFIRDAHKINRFCDIDKNYYIYGRRINVNTGKLVI